MSKVQHYFEMKIKCFSSWTNFWAPLSTSTIVYKERETVTNIYIAINNVTSQFYFSRKRNKMTIIFSILLSPSFPHFTERFGIRNLFIFPFSLCDPTTEVYTYRCLLFFRQKEVLYPCLLHTLYVHSLMVIFLQCQMMETAWEERKPLKKTLQVVFFLQRVGKDRNSYRSWKWK